MTCYYQTRLTPAVTVSVFVTNRETAEREDPAITGAPIRTGRWFYLDDYENKAEFIKAASEYTATIQGEDVSPLYYADHKTYISNDIIPTKEVDALISHHVIDENMWEMLTISQNHAKMLGAYIEFFGADDRKSSLELLEAARYNRKGEYTTLTELGMAYLHAIGSTSLWGFTATVNAELLEELDEKFVGHNGFWFYRANDVPAQA